MYDDSSKLLDSRLLRKDELIESGATLSFETHIVDIGEPEETHHPLQDMHADGSHGKSKVKVENVQKFKGSFLGTSFLLAFFNLLIEIHISYFTCQSHLDIVSSFYCRKKRKEVSV